MIWPAYPQVRESGIDWLGRIPADWEITKFRHCFRESSEKNGAVPVGSMLSVSGYRGIEVKQYDDENQRRATEQLEDYRVVRVGQLAVNTMWLNYAGLGVSEFEGHISPAYRSYWINPNLDKRYVHHLMRSTAYVDGYTALLTGVRPNSLQMGRDDLMGFPVLRPSLPEQRSIARFLDDETAKIDALIAKQEQLIATLQERRGAVADQILSAPGFTQPLKRVVADVTVGIVVTPAAWYADEGVPALRGLNIRPGLVTSDDLVYLTPEGDALHAKSRLCAGDVVMVRTGQAGSAAVIPSQLSGANAIDLLIIRPGTKADPDFLAAYFNAPSTREKIAHGSVGAIQGHFNVSALRELEFPSIDVAEQRRRAEQWSIEAGNIDALIEKTKTFIKISREYRSALITDAVTGKIDVRRAA